MNVQLRLAELRDAVAIATYRTLGRLGLQSHPLGSKVFLGAYDWYKQWTDRPALTFMRRTVKRGDIVIDVGANVGFYTVRLAQLVGPQGLVLACEPAEWASNVLRARISKGLVKNVTLHTVALADAPGEEALHLGLFPGDSRLYEHDAATQVQRVPVQTLDALCRALPKAPRLVKIDVQGAEVRVLKGMPEMLAGSHPPTVLLEFWPKGLRAAGYDPLEIFRYAEGFGLRSGSLNGNGQVTWSSGQALLDVCGRDGYIEVVLQAGDPAGGT